MTPLLILEVEQVDLNIKLVSVIEDICLTLISVSSSRLEHRAPEVTAHFAVECVSDAISQHSDQNLEVGIVVSIRIASGVLILQRRRLVSSSFD